MNKTLATLIGAAVLATMSTLAQAQVCDQCGTPPPPPPPPVTTSPPVITPPPLPFVCNVKGNAGIGNRGEGMANERNDCDPGNSGAHNQAWRNADKPHKNR